MNKLAFMSTNLGLRVSDGIRTIANKIGYIVKIVDGVNQNGIMSILASLCAKYDITLLKNPSYLPERKAFRIKADVSEIPTNTKEEFDKMTGCEVIV